LSWLNIPDSENGREMIISPVGPSSELDNDPLHQYIQSRLRASDKMELDRLLYVACTRARKSLHLIGHVNTSQDNSEMKDPHSGSLLQRLWPALEPEFAKAFATYDGKPATQELADDAMYATPILRRTAKGWTMPASPTLPQGHASILPQEDTGDKQVEFYWVGTAARHAGTIVHRWLHKFAVDNQWPQTNELDDTDAMTRRWANDLRVNDNELDFVCNRVLSALQGMLEDTQGCWILGGDGHAELALTGIWQNRPESIVIDRVRIDDEGVHWIIDYKTSTHEGGDLEGFMQQETDRYRPQLQKYASIYRNFASVPVKAALYFPLLKQFRQVSFSDQQTG
jgi:ATP-dependent exoDNAse (exonuclease V) beta subunit